jgi:hypothetical protein
MHFGTKSYLKSTRNHTAKHTHATEDGTDHSHSKVEINPTALMSFSTKFTG